MSILFRLAFTYVWILPLLTWQLHRERIAKYRDELALSVCPVNFNTKGYSAKLAKYTTRSTRTPTITRRTLTTVARGNALCRQRRDVSRRDNVTYPTWLPVNKHVVRPLIHHAVALVRVDPVAVVGGGHHADTRQRTLLWLAVLVRVYRRDGLRVEMIVSREDGILRVLVRHRCSERAITATTLRVARAGHYVLGGESVGRACVKREWLGVHKSFDVSWV